MGGWKDGRTLPEEERKGCLEGSARGGPSAYLLDAEKGVCLRRLAVDFPGRETLRVLGKRPSVLTRPACVRTAREFLRMRIHTPHTDAGTCARTHRHARARAHTHTEMKRG